MKFTEHAISQRLLNVTILMAVHGDDSRMVDRYCAVVIIPNNASYTTST